MRIRSQRVFGTAALTLLLAAAPVVAERRAASGGPLPRLLSLVSEAGADLRRGEPELAESRYRAAIAEAWMLLGTIEAAGGENDAATEAFQNAEVSIFDNRRPRRLLAAHLRDSGQAEEAVRMLRVLFGQFPTEPGLREELAEALFAAGRSDEAIAELEELAAIRPDDPEAAFTLAGAYLRSGSLDRAQTLFERVAEARPIPQTHLLIGRTLRDYQHFAEARARFEKALEMDPDVPRARFYLGTLVLQSQGEIPLEEAIDYFEAELRAQAEAGADPSADATTQLVLGLSLTEARRFEEAIPHLRLAAEAEDSARDAYHYLGRSLLALDRVDEAIEALEEALELGRDAPQDQLTSLHYQLATALRRQGRAEEAKPHFDAAKRSSGTLTSDLRDELRRFLADRAPTSGGDTTGLRVQARDWSSDARRELKERLEKLIAQGTFDLGVMQMRKGRFAVADRFLATAAELQPDFPRVHYSLGVARFNAGLFAEAIEPLERAREETPDDVETRRMLAVAQLNAGRYGPAADLLAEDPELRSLRSLEYSYALALVRSGRTAQAAEVFESLLSRHGDWAELRLLMAQAHAQDGDFPGARALFREALDLDPRLPEAHAGLGEIDLRIGELESARDHFQAELELRPRHAQTRFHLATVLDLLQEHERAREELERALADDPDHADARYLLGKVLLAEGRPALALPQLEAAVGLAPENPNVRYQLAQTYQRLGRRDEAARAFETYRTLKKAQREDSP